MIGAVVRALRGGAAPDPGDDDATDLAPARRARLRDVQAAMADAGWKAEQALATADRALAAVVAARDAMEEHADVGDRIAAFHAGLLRAGGTGRRPALPADLAAARTAAFAAEVELADAEATHDLLSVEAREAAGVAVEAGAKLRAAADELAAAEMQAVMATVRRAELEAGRARVMLAGYMNTRALSDPPLPFSLTQLLVDPWHVALSEASGASWQAAAAQWNSYRHALLSDAAAVFVT